MSEQTPDLTSTLAALTECMTATRSALAAPKVEPLLLDREQLAEALGGISTDTLDRLDSAGKLPKPVPSLCRRTLWNRAWINSGCPCREVWQAMNKTSNGHAVVTRR